MLWRPTLLRDVIVFGEFQVLQILESSGPIFALYGVLAAEPLKIFGFEIFTRKGKLNLESQGLSIRSMEGHVFLDRAKQTLRYQLIPGHSWSLAQRDIPFILRFDTGTHIHEEKVNENPEETQRLLFQVHPYQNSPKS